MTTANSPMPDFEAYSPHSRPRGWASKLQWCVDAAAWLICCVVVIVSFREALSPESAFKAEFEKFAIPSRLTGTDDMIISNTRLHAKWDRSLLKCITSGEATATVDIRTSLPTRLLDAGEITNKKAYLSLLQQGQIHSVQERITVHFVRNGLSWKPKEQDIDLSADTQIKTYVTRQSAGPLQFVADTGPYTTNQAEANGRGVVDYSIQVVGIVLFTLPLLIGLAAGVATGSSMLPVYGWAVSGVFHIAFQYLDNSLISSMTWF